MRFRVQLLTKRGGSIVRRGSLSQGRALLRQIQKLDLVDAEADAELDIVRPNTALAEFIDSAWPRLSFRRPPSASLTAACPPRTTALYVCSIVSSVPF
jgi:hypothetical protein